MSVYTTVSHDELATWLTRYSVGQLTELKGIAAGITNTNYFVTTTQGRYVLTLFETLDLEQLPYYLDLMSHLAKHGVACPAPIADHTDNFCSRLAGKPACLVTCLSGKDVEAPSVKQCFALGEMLAALHQAGATFPQRMYNPRGPEWWSAAAAAVYPHMSETDAKLLSEEIHYQDNHRFTHLPSGVIHADLFRDNVLFDGERIAGFIDFYYACNDFLLYDVAIALNDWARQEDGSIDDERARALLAGYQSQRAFSDEEKIGWPVMLRAAALRFWVSRLLDMYQPMEGELTYIKDPQVFQQVIADHRQRQDFWL